jgi:hypothetical protein
MAACNLKIEIDDPSRVRVGGETITGTVVVTAEKNVNCKAFDVTCCWMTHGRGNVARGDVETQTLYQGEWQEGQVYRYPFKLKSATWPPTYYGNHLNVGHYIEAKAKLPWKLDPKTQQEFTLVATETPADLTPTQVTKAKASGVGWIVGVLVLGLFMFTMLPLFFILLPVVAIAGGLFWFFRVFLPRRITGTVDLVIEPGVVSSGESLTGRFEFTPQSNTSINGIKWTILCTEKCISGSGSNRTTHTHEVLRKEITLMEAGQLVAGKRQQYDLSFAIPQNAPPSLKFTDNELKWGSQVRIDIPRWPDWVKELPFVVKASSTNQSVNAGLPPGMALDSEAGANPLVATVISPHDDDDPWFTEVLQQITHAESDEEKLSKILDAVAGQEFAIVVDTQGEVDEPIDSDVDFESTWIGAVDKARNVRMVLCLPEGFEADSSLWVNDWQAIATIHGLDGETGRIMMQVVRVS